MRGRLEEEGRGRSDLNKRSLNERSNTNSYAGPQLHLPRKNSQLPLIIVAAAALLLAGWHWALSAGELRCCSCLLLPKSISPLWCLSSICFHYTCVPWGLVRQHLEVVPPLLCQQPRGHKQLCKAHRLLAD